MAKLKEIVYIVLAILALVVLSLVLGLNGTKNVDYRYVMLEVNPKVEFLTDKNDMVVSVYAINNEAKELLAGENFVGEKVCDAATKFVDLCVKANYIDVDRDDNAIRLNTVSGLMHGLDINVFKNLTKYIKGNQIKCVIVENQNDLNRFKQAKEVGVGAKKYSLIKAVTRFEPNLSVKQAKELSEKDLMDRIYMAHKNLKQTFTQEDFANKTKLIDFNRSKINNHNSNMTDNTISKFKDDYKEYEISMQKKFEKDFDGQSAKWKENKLNEYYA